MRTFCIILAGFGVVLGTSCETTPDRAAGGGAFDDSYLSRRLDSNNPDLSGNLNEKGKPAVPSYEQWRESE
jgi:hypothetical protein